MASLSTPLVGPDQSNISGMSRIIGVDMDHSRDVELGLAWLFRQGGVDGAIQRKYNSGARGAASP